jgi:phospholipase/lecithinase/hemolysin
VTKVLQGLARTNGSLGQNENYRTYYVSGTSMGNGQIPGQFDSALNDGAVQNPKEIKYVLMDGGGNDILLLNSMCLSVADPANNASCKASVEKSAAAATALLQKMGDNGVEEVVYFFYPELNPGLATGTMPNKVNSYGFDIMKNLCESATAVKCHFIDTRPAFAGKNAQYIGVDGIHPTLAGSTVIANLMWDVMKANCIAQ